MTCMVRLLFVGHSSFLGSRPLVGAVKLCSEATQYLPGALNPKRLGLEQTSSITQ